MTHSRPRIVVVDADIRALARARRLLGAAGFDVETFEGPGPRLARALDSLPDLVLLELELPGLGGEALFRSFRDLPDLQGVPVVFFSGADESVLRRTAIGCGAAGYISKQTLAGELALTVSRFLENAASESRQAVSDPSPSLPPS